ncbi:MAG: rod shape-determining protein MreD [Acidobacteria bacterium]|nr:rod shape-determining protein MreD [Acidobacteriota bacterium]
MVSPLGRAVRVGLGLLFVGTLQTLLPNYWLALGHIDFMMIAVGLLALRSHFRSAVLIGAVGGLLQDSLAGGIIGLHAFAKTAVAAGLAAIADLFAVRGQLAEALIVGVATALEAMIVRSLLAFLEWPGTDTLPQIATRAAITGLICGIGTVGIPLAMASWKRRRRGGLRWN